MNRIATLPLHFWTSALSFLDSLSIASFSSTSKFIHNGMENNSLWESSFNSYNSDTFKCYQKKDYFKSNNDDVKYPPWYQPNKSYLQLYLFLKEIEKRNGTKLVNQHVTKFKSPIFVSKEQDSKFLYSINEKGDVLEFYSYYFSYEISSSWVFLTRVNSVSLFLPLFDFHYQHGSGWHGLLFPSPIRVSHSLLGVRGLSDDGFATKMLQIITLTERDMEDPPYFLNEWNDFLLSQNYSKRQEVRVQDSCTHFSDQDPELAKFNHWLIGIDEIPFLQELATRTYERKEKERKEAFRKEQRGPATDEELTLWNKLMWKADRGHKDGPLFKEEWDKLWNAVCQFPRPHLEHFINKVVSDLGRTMLWSCAKRDWVEEAKWAMSYGADPFSEAGKGSAYEIANHYKCKEVLALFHSLV